MNLAEIGKALRTARESRRLTQGELGKLARMSRTTISLLENGMVGELGIRKIMTLCDILGVELQVALRPAPPTLAQLMAENEQDRKADQAKTSEVLSKI